MKGMTGARKVKITINNLTMEAEIRFDRNPETADAFWKSLPIQGNANVWGEEIYFRIPVKVGEEKSTEFVEKGDIAYWPHGESICIFFGPTPISGENEIRAASPVNVIGKIVKGLENVRKIKPGAKVRIETLT